MSQDREPRYFDFIHQHEERLNLIYSRWEAQIAKQNAANNQKTLVEKIKSQKKAFVAVGAIAFGSASLLACKYSQNINSLRTLVASNSQKLERIKWESKGAAAVGSKRSCIASNDDIYQLNSGSLNRQNIHPLLSQPRTLIAQLNTVSVTRHSSEIKQPDAYFRLKPDRTLLFGEVEKTEDILQTTTQEINLDRDPASFAGHREIKNYIQVQEKAIALHEELSQCFVENHLLNTNKTFWQFPYAD
ncbi:MAG: hypothetical protein AAFO95_04895 [Cyanobacteria bacterium J06600_6]